MNALATKAIIFNESGEVLILKKSESEGINPKTADIPGGRLEFGEKPEEGLKREIEEEVGLDIDIIAPSRVWSMVRDELYLVGVTFLALCKNNADKLSLSNEHESYLWLDPSKIINNKNYPSWIQEEIEAVIKIKEWSDENETDK